MINLLKNRFRAMRSEESGFTTAELLGNAALGILALVAVWQGLRILGTDVVQMIRTQLIK